MVNRDENIKLSMGKGKSTVETEKDNIYTKCKRWEQRRGRRQGREEKKVRALWRTAASYQQHIHKEQKEQ